MPQTEVPTSPPGKPPEPSSKRGSTRYEELEPDELLHLIDRLEDERSASRRREGIWVSFIAHLLLFWFLIYGPKFRSHQPHVVTPAPSKKDFTYLDLPPDAQKHIRHNPQATPSDKNRLAESPHPTLDRKTLQQLQAMRQAGPPQPTPPSAPPQAPAPAPAAPPQQQQAQQQARNATPPPPPAPTPQQSLPPEPTPVPTQPNFDTGPQTAGDAIRQAERNAAQGGSGSSGDYGQNAPSQHQAMKAGADILSDTLGVDFGPYMKRLIADTYRSWIPLIPESARPPLDKRGRVGIRFKILPDGSVKEMTLEFPSGDVSLDKAAWGGIKFASYPALPKEFKGPFLELRFGFYYNLDPDKSH